MPFGEQFPTFRKVRSPHLQSQVLHVALLRINQEILTVKAILPDVCESSPNDTASQPNRLWISTISERNSNLAWKQLSNSLLLTGLSVGQEKLCSVSTHWGYGSKIRTKKQTNISSQTQDSKTECTQNPSTKMYEITEANLLTYLTYKLKFHLARAKRRLFYFPKTN
jgi:hypothetical protein